MFNSPVLELGIGLIFVYLIFGLVCTAINEAISSVLNLRGRMLLCGIKKLLGDASGTGLAKGVLTHPLVSGLGIKTAKNGSVDATSMPAALPTPVFSLALIAVLAQLDERQLPRTVSELDDCIDDLPAANLSKGALQALVSSAGTDFGKARANIEYWFDQAMASVSASYKRGAQVASVIIALIIVTASNADTVMIANRLWADQSMRQALANIATKYVSQNSSNSGPTVGIASINSPAPVKPASSKSTRSKAASASPPQKQPAQTTGIAAPDTSDLLSVIGWDSSAIMTGDPEATRTFPTRIWPQGLLKVCGLLITAFAASLGAPFWFDILNRLVAIRGAGDSTDDSGK